MRTKTRPEVGEMEKARFNLADNKYNEENPLH